MSYADLLDRIQGRDPDAFLEMTERYGWAVYTAIRQKHPDLAEADRIYDETMNSFYNSLSRSAAEDPVEALLCAFAEHVSPVNADSSGKFGNHREAPPQLQLRCQELPVQNVRKCSGMKHFWMGALFFLVVIVLLTLLWLTAGVMMAMDYIPFYDFGYSWFDANIFDFF